MIPDDGPVWPKHALNLHESMEQVVIHPVDFVAALKDCFVYQVDKERSLSRIS
jgi:hypothetical protein